MTNDTQAHYYTRQNGAQSQGEATSKERIPPHNIEAEQAVLGSVLIDPNCCYLAYDRLEAGDFYREVHGVIYEAMQSLSKSGTAIDLITLEDELRRTDNYERAGGFTYLRMLMDAPATSANLEYYCGVVLETSHLRTLMQMSRAIYRSADRMEESSEEIIEKIDGLLTRMRGGGEEGPKLVGTLAQTEVLRLRERAETHSKLSGVQTPLDSLDYLTGGFQTKTLTILAARPGMGKTALALQCAEVAARTTMKPALFISLEMSTEELIKRLLCSISRIDMGRFKTGYLSTDEWDRVEEACEEIASLPLWIDDNSDLTVSGMRNSLHRVEEKSGGKCSFFVVDYLQIVAGNNSWRGESEVEKHGRVANELKRLAKAEDVPVMALAQLNRAVESRPDKRPILSDLHGSGKIEAEADTVMMLYRASYYKKSGEEDETGETEKAEIIVNKQRSGACGVVEAAFAPRYTKFSEYETRWGDDY